ncbi:DUF4974 domain-containing protein [Aureivirga marina]|uniref:DUF4974 domain-containing protein n=1 Tax=Aureivirga marina TaxID=1182451 RepID=UPI0018C96DC6|nr:DUF4974 domain-containing protein [Aureivirga marina]
MKKNLFMCALCMSFCCYAQKKVEIRFTKENEKLHYVEEVEEKEFKEFYSGYTIEAFLLNFFDTNSQWISNKLKRNRKKIEVKLLYKNKKEREELKQKIITELSDLLRLKLDLKEEEKEMFVAKFENNLKLKHCIRKEGNVLTETFGGINWKADCVSISYMLQQVEKWYGIEILCEISDESSYDFALKFVEDLEELIKKIDEKYGIQIRIKKQKIERIVLL